MYGRGMFWAAVNPLKHSADIKQHRIRKRSRLEILIVTSSDVGGKIMNYKTIFFLLTVRLILPLKC